jgi:lysylphosphatidylglycerol synthetase-like protein (DUF2156 family)
MKTKIVGWLFIIASPVFLFSFLAFVIFPLVFGGGFIEDLTYFWIGIIALILAIYAFILGSSVKARKRWAWYAGLITIILGTLGNIGYIIMQFSLLLVVALLVDAFAIYAFLSEKNLFFQEPSTQPPVQLVSIQPQVNDLATPPLPQPALPQ